MRAYKSGLKSIPNKFEPLTLHPWEDSGKGSRKHPKFLNKASLIAYAFVVLTPLLWLFMKAASLTSKEPSISNQGELFGYNMSQIAIGLLIWWLMAKLYRRGRRHAMIPGNKLLKKDNRDVVLYLRTFLDDSTIKMWVRANDGRIFLGGGVLSEIAWRFSLNKLYWGRAKIGQTGGPRGSCTTSWGGGSVENFGAISERTNPGLRKGYKIVARILFNSQRATIVERYKHLIGLRRSIESP